MPEIIAFETSTFPADPALRALAERIAATFRLAVEKVAAHHGDPAAYPLPDDPDSPERLLASRFTQLPPEVQQPAAERALAAVEAPEAVRVQQYGALAKVNLHSTNGLAAQVATIQLPHELEQLTQQHLLDFTKKVQASGGLAPQQSPNMLRLRIRRVTCIDETGKETPWSAEPGIDTILMGGSAIDDRAAVTAIPAFHVGKFDDGDEQWFAPWKVFAAFDLQKGVTGTLAASSWPKVYSAMIVLAEEDHGGFPEFLQKLWDAVQKEVKEYFATKLGIVIGGAIGTALPGVGTLLGMAIGFAVGLAVDLIVAAIKDIWDDDVFDPVTVNCTVGANESFFSGYNLSPVDTQRRAGHDGEYEIEYDWRVDWASPWAGWEDLGGVLSTPPAATSWQANRFDAFALGSDSALWHKWWDGNKWRDWEPVGQPEKGALSSAPAAVSWGPNRIDIVARGPHDHLWHLSWDKKWSAWEDLEGGVIGAPAISSWGFNRLDCFVRGTDNHLWHKWWNGKWNGWQDLGAPPGGLTSAPAALAWDSNTTYCFGRGGDNHLYQTSWDGTKWSDWLERGGVLSSGPAIVRSGDHLDCFVRGTDNHLWHREWDGTRWYEWEGMNGNLDGEPAAVSNRSARRIDLFVRSQGDNRLRHRWMIR